MSPISAVTNAFGWLTVLPVRSPDTAPDRSTGAGVIAAVPVVGIALGALAVAVAFGLSATALPDTMIGILIVAGLAGATRGMHLDGLSDTADGLGCYGPPERVAEVMRGGSAGPFGVATLILVLGVQWSGFTALVAGNRWYELGFAIAVARIAAVVGCRRGLSAAHQSGFGALVAGTQSVSIAVWAAVAAGAAALSGFLGGTASPGPHVFDVGTALHALLVVAAVLAVGWAFTRHCARRMGGITGDVLGAVIELGVAVAVVGLMV